MTTSVQNKYVLNKCFKQTTKTHEEERRTKRTAFLTPPTATSYPAETVTWSTMASMRFQLKTSGAVMFSQAQVKVSGFGGGH